MGGKPGEGNSHLKRERCGVKLHQFGGLDLVKVSV